MYIIDDSNQQTTPREDYTAHSQTPSSEYTRAPVFERIMARIIDSIIEGIFMVPILIWSIKIVMRDIEGYYDYMDGLATGLLMAEFGFVMILYIVLWLVSVAYSLLRDGLMHGQSIGKRIMGLKTIKVESGRGCDYTSSLIRNLIHLILCSFLPFLGPIIELALVCTRQDGRRLADMVANTIVVRA